MMGTVSRTILPETWLLISDYFARERHFWDNEYNCLEKIVIVDEEKYYLRSFGDIEIGDLVEMVVLPRSRLVLRMEKIESDRP